MVHLRFLGINYATWADPTPPANPADPMYLLSDPFHFFLPYFNREDTIIVCSVGNEFEDENSPNDSEYEFPRRNAKVGRTGENSLIVVGGTDKNGLIWAKQVLTNHGVKTIGTNKFFSLITTMAPAADMSCANSHNGGWKKDWGTSLSAGFVSGLVATFLGHPQFTRVSGSIAADMKRFVRDVSKYHTKYEDYGGILLDVIGTHNYVPCDAVGTTSAKVKRQSEFEEFPPIPIRRPGFLKVDEVRIQCFISNG
jgi:hypothetical protein